MSIIKPRTATVVIYQGDDLEGMVSARNEAQVAERVAAEAKQAAEFAQRQATVRAATARLGDDDDSPSQLDVAAQAAEDAAQGKRDAYDAFVGEAAERAVEVRLRAIGTHRFRTLVREHPPREVPDGEGAKVHDDDAQVGVNVDTFPRSLLAYVDADDPAVRTVIEPSLSPKDLTGLLDDDLSDGDFERCWQTAYSLNRGVGADPLASRYSVTSRT